MPTVPNSRIRTLNEVPLNGAGEYVLYWMVAYRRGCWNYALDRAIELSEESGKPLIVLEALRCDYPWASDRLHHLHRAGMRDNLKRLAKTNIAYYPYVEPSRGAGRGLLAALAVNAVAAVSDDYPCFFLPAQHRAAARQIRVASNLSTPTACCR